MKPLRILLADDHTLVRAGIRTLLEQMPGVEVVGEADDGLEALALIEVCQPDLLLVDIAMPGLNGLETAARVAKEFPRVKVTILSMHANEEYVMQALRAGAVGYLLKDSATVELELALKAVGRGEMYVIVTLHDCPEYRRKADDAGADGYICKSHFTEAVSALIDSFFSGPAGPSASA